MKFLKQRVKTVDERQLDNKNEEAAARDIRRRVDRVNRDKREVDRLKQDERKLKRDQDDLQRDMRRIKESCKLEENVENTSNRKSALSCVIICSPPLSEYNEAGY